MQERGRSRRWFLGVRDEVRLQTELLTIGRFDAKPHDSGFETAGPISTPVFVFPRSSVWIEHDGARPFVSDPNWITCYNTRQPYRRRRISHDGDICDWFRLRPDVLLDVIRSVDPSAEDPDTPFRRARMASDPRTCLVERRLFRDMIRLEPLVVEETVLSMLAHLLRLDAGQSTCRGVMRGRPAQVDAVEQAKGLLGRAFAARLGLGDVSRAVGCSQFHLCRVFKTHTGVTLHQYREQLRVRESLSRLLDTDAEVTQIALSVGYSTHSHFTWAFHRVFGVTPSVVRARGRRPAEIERKLTVAYGVWPS